MPIIIQADTAAELPEGLRPAAKEMNGKFVVEAMPEGWGLDNVAQTRSKLTRAEQDLRRSGERLKAFAKDDKGTLFEPDEFTALLTEHRTLKEAQGRQPNVDEMRKQIVADAEQRLGKKLTEAEKRAVDLERELDNTTLDSAINQLVAEMRPKEGKAEIVRLLLREKLGIDKADGKRNVRVRSADGKDWQSGASQDGFLSPKDYALNVLRTQQADMFQGDGASGAGANGSGNGGRKSKYTFPAADLNGNYSAYEALKKRAAAEGATVEFV